MIADHKAQSAAWGLLIILVFIAISGGLVDIYRLYSARNWAYTVAQEAALAGASRGRDWEYLASTGKIRLVSDIANPEAETLVRTEMESRGVIGYSMDVRTLSDPSGGVISGFPPNPVRLGDSRGNWTSSEPAVGVYLVVPVDWVFLDSLGITGKTISVFASAGVAQ